MSLPELRLVETAAEVPSREPLEESQPAHAFVVSLQREDPVALGRLYAEHHLALRRFGLRLLGDRHQAEDLLHDVFVDVPLAMRGYRGDCSLRAFLLAVAVKKAGKLRRRIARFQKALGRLASGGSRAAAPQPESVLELRQFSTRFAEELGRLPFGQRAAVVLCLVEERSAGEAAIILGIPEATVRTRVFYGRQRLRERLEEHR
jgi:RNA polymerase sigma-70 factor (ECF subfamily)